MEFCKKVQVESEYVTIHVEDSTNFYTRLRFSLLASPRFPCPLGLALWSVLHMLLVLSKILLLLAIYCIVFAIAVSLDALTLCYVVLILIPWVGLVLCRFMNLHVVVFWIWLLISCNVPGREPGQTLAHYIRTGGGKLALLPPSPPAEEQTTAARLRGLFGVCWQHLQELLTAVLVDYLIFVAIPYWRVNLGNLCGEIVPTYDAVVVI